MTYDPTPDNGTFTEETQNPTPVAPEVAPEETPTE